LEKTVFFSRLYPRSLKKDEETGKSPVYQSFLAYGLFPAGLPRRALTMFKPEHNSAAQWPPRADFPNHSYGIAEDFHPTSFEIYETSIRIREIFVNTSRPLPA
jgi:hypothetical protein